MTCDGATDTAGNTGMAAVSYVVREPNPPATLTPTETLEPRALTWLAREAGVTGLRTVTELLESEAWPRVEAAITRGIEKANNQAVSNVARIKRWRVLKRDFAIDGGELSPTLKLKRFHIAKMYKDEIDLMYN